jgi:hypothetical protein
MVIFGENNFVAEFCLGKKEKVPLSWIVNIKEF